MPIDIEEARERTAGPVFQHIPPPPVRWMRDAHVVGDYVGDQAHVVLLERCREAQEGVFIADFRIEPRLIGDIVSMQAAWTGHKERGSVDIGDSEFVEVIDDGGGLVEWKEVVELEPVSGRGRIDGLRFTALHLDGGPLRSWTLPGEEHFSPKRPKRAGITSGEGYPRRPYWLGRRRRGRSIGDRRRRGSS